MTHTIEKTSLCPHCGGALAAPAPAPVSTDPATAFDLEALRYDLEALAAEAATDRSFDESAKVRVTQQDIRKLLEKRRRSPR